MNIVPTIIPEDPEPMANTAAGMLGFSIEGSGNRYSSAVLTSEEMMTRPVYEGKFVVPFSSPPRSNLYEKTVKLSGETNTWRGIPCSTFQYINGTITYVLQAMVPDEIKGIIAIQIYDYANLQPSNGTMPFDINQMRIRTEFWNLEVSKEFSFSISPTSRLNTKQRWRPGSDENEEGGAIFYYYKADGGFLISKPQTTQYRDPDLTGRAIFRVFNESTLQASPNQPSQFEVNVWTSYTNTFTSFPKSYPEFEGETV